MLEKLQVDGLSDRALRVISSITPLTGTEKSLAEQAADDMASQLADDPKLKDCGSLKDKLFLASDTQICFWLAHMALSGRPSFFRQFAGKLKTEPGPT